MILSRCSICLTSLEEEFFYNLDPKEPALCPNCQKEILAQDILPFLQNLLTERDFYRAETNRLGVALLRSNASNPASVFYVQEPPLEE